MSHLLEILLTLSIMQQMQILVSESHPMCFPAWKRVKQLIHSYYSAISVLADTVFPHSKKYVFHELQSES